LGGTSLQVPGFLATLAEAQSRCGLLSEALATVEQALPLARPPYEGLYEAELYRLKGELTLLTSGEANAAEGCFQRSLSVARQQNARSFSLRTAISLARLWRQQGRTAAAYDLLADIYHQFNEGFTTADLQTAAAILADLSPSA
jgi:tetratricopeptide (TPR) repeat protein